MAAGLRVKDPLNGKSAAIILVEQSFTLTGFRLCTRDNWPVKINVSDVTIIYSRMYLMRN